MKPSKSQLIGMLEITHINIALSAKAGKQKRRRVNQEILDENARIEHNRLRRKINALELEIKKLKDELEK